MFIQQQVRALGEVADVAVLHVSLESGNFAPTLTHEDGATIVRAAVAGKPLEDNYVRFRPVDRIVRKFFAAKRLLLRYSRFRPAGIQAFDLLQAEWGMPDIIHVQALFPAAIIARSIARKYALPYVVTEHSEEYLAHSKRRLVRTPGMVRFVLRPMAAGAARTIAVSRYLADRLIELGLAKNPVVIPNVVPVSPQTPLPMQPPHIITHVSVMGPAKNLPVLIDAIDVLRHRRTDFSLRLVGDGECRQGIERQVDELDLRDYVDFTGRKSPNEVNSLLANSAFSIISSTHETFSVSAAESLMCGRPVLSTRCGGPEEFITPEVGRLVDAQSQSALVEGLDWMLEHFAEFDPLMLHEYAVRKFSPLAVAQQLLLVYQEVLNC